MANVFEPRPAFADIVRFSKAWHTEAVARIEQAMQRKNCPVSWIQFVVDKDGFLVILRLEDVRHLGNAKSAAKVVLDCLPDEAARLNAMKSLRPLDEVDANRIRAWQTVASLRPRGEKRAREEDQSDEDELAIHFVKRARSEPTEVALVNPQPPVSNKKSAAQLLAELSNASDSSDEEEVAPPRFMLTDGPAPGGSEEEEPDLLDPTSVWGHKVKTEATIVLAEVGERPERLFYIQCRHEVRRQLLLQSKVREEYERVTMLCVVKVAMQLVQDGSLPGPGEHGRVSEFLKRCATALQAIDCKAETDIKKLSAEEQALIRSALGGKGVPYDGCFNEGCLDQTTTWVAQGDMSLCSRCKVPKSFGRNWRGLGDILRPSVRREFAMRSSMAQLSGIDLFK